MSDTDQKPLTIEEATEPVVEEPSADVRAWQDRKVRAAIKSADAGKFATPEDLKATIRKFVPHG